MAFWKWSITVCEVLEQRRALLIVLGTYICLVVKVDDATVDT